MNMEKTPLTFFEWIVENTKFSKARAEGFWLVMYIAFFIVILIEGIKNQDALWVLIAPVYMFFSQWRHYVHYKRGFYQAKNQHIDT